MKVVMCMVSGRGGHRSGQGYDFSETRVIRGLVMVVVVVGVCFLVACSMFLSGLFSVLKNYLKSIYDHPDHYDQASNIKGFVVIDWSWWS